MTFLGDTVPTRIAGLKAVLLVAGDKSGGSSRRFYRALIRKADARLDNHLRRLEREEPS